MKHTSGRLIASNSGIWEKEPGDGPNINLLASTLLGSRDDETNHANAKRLVDCWNACEGINPEAVPALLEALETELSRVNSLLAMVQSKTAFSKILQENRDNLQAAIAKARP